MERVFGGRYDVKRAAPGVMTPNSRGWATHDCTTLGGNSGSAVIDLATGKAVALHFAGAYVIENYAVPASTIRDYLKRRPWNGGAVDDARRQRGTPRHDTGAAASAIGGRSAAGSLGVHHAAAHHHGFDRQPGDGRRQAGCRDAVLRPLRSRRPCAASRPPIAATASSACGPDLVIKDGKFTDTPCIHVVTHPEKVAAVRARCPGRVSRPSGRRARRRHRRNDRRPGCRQRGRGHLDRLQ